MHIIKSLRKGFQLLGLSTMGFLPASTALAQATGGTITTSGAYTIHTFTAGGTFTVNGAITADVVVVGGGGGGGHQHAGGGGAGGVVLLNGLSVAAGSYTMAVGDGGAGCTWHPYTGNNGGNSSALGYTAIGGGAGTGMPQYGNSGGSGGGDGYPSGGVQGGNGTAGQGNTGSRGNSVSQYNGGGGGGAGGAGNGAGGGAALATWAGSFAGGGGGGFAGGLGGGAGAGNGGYGAAAGGSAAANTGSGGGGGGNYDAFGGNGGSGKITIRYLTPANVAPTVSAWAGLPANPLYAGTNFTARATGSDTNGNLSTIFVDSSVNGGAWAPFAYNGVGANGGNGYATTSDGNGVVAGLPGTTYQFRAQAADGAGANSGWQYTSVYTVANRPPTVSWAVLPPATINSGTWFPVRATGNDLDGNLSGIWVEFSVNGGTWQALAYDPAGVNGGNGFATTSNNNGVTPGVTGTTYQFRAQANDGAGTNSGWQYTSVYTVAPVVKSDQTGVAGSLGAGSVTFPGTTTVTATGGQSGGAYEFRQNGGTGAVTFSGTGATRTLTPTTAGTAVIEVRKLGDASYNDSAWIGAGTLTINKGTQAALAAVATPAAQNYPATVALSTTGGSGGGAVTYALVSGPGAIAGSTLTPTGVGTVVLTATKATDTNYNAITSPNLSVAISKGDQSGVGGSLGAGSVTLSTTTTVTATGGQSGGAYEFRQNGGTGAVTISGTGATRTLTPTTAGTAVIEVRKLGDANYNDSAWIGAGTLSISSAPAATGGTVTTDGNYTIHTFTTGGTFATNSALTVDFLIIGGGGGGSSGGGGAGGLSYLTGIALPAGSYPITVGAGGAGNGGFTGPASAGGWTFFNNYYAWGGGGGGSALTIDCGAGGSGGGAGRYWNPSPAPGAAGSPGEGYAGGSSPGNSSSLAPAGGGGGAGGVGLDGIAATNTSGAGGPGVSISITGTPVHYAGGGGGGSTNAVTAGAGGIGGGGAGSSVNGVPGTAGTNGRGGGGGGSFDSTANGGAGGSGIVIIRYLTAQKPIATVTLGNLNQTYTGSPLSATTTTIPSGLTVNITYDGSPTAPTGAGTYTVVGTINDATYQGSATGTLTVTATPSYSVLWQPSLPGGGGTPPSRSADGVWSYRYDTLSLDALAHPASATWSASASEPYLAKLATQTSLLPAGWWNVTKGAWAYPAVDPEANAMLLGADSNQKFSILKSKAPTAASPYALNADGYNPILAFKAPLSGNNTYSVKASIVKAGDLDVAKAQTFGDGVLVEVYRVKLSGVNPVTRLWSTLLTRSNPTAPAKINLLTELDFGDEIFFRVSSPTTDGANDLVQFTPEVKLAQISTFTVPKPTPVTASSTDAINAKLVEAAAAAAGAGCDRAVVQLESGVYYLGDPSTYQDSAYLGLSGMSNVTLKGDPTAGTALIAKDFKRAFVRVAANSANVNLENLVFDYEQGALPFIQATVDSPVAGDPAGFVRATLKWQPNNPADFTTTTGATPFGQGFPAGASDPALAKSTAGTFWTIPTISGNLLTFQTELLNSTPILAEGDSVILRKIPNPPEGALVFYSSTDCELQNVTVRAAANLTIFGVDLNGLHLNRYKVERSKTFVAGAWTGTDRLMGAGKDGVHLQGSRRGPSIENSSFDGLGDDGVNVHAQVEDIPPGTIQAASGGTQTFQIPAPRNPVKVNDVLVFFSVEFANPADPQNNEYLGVYVNPTHVRVSVISGTTVTVVPIDGGGLLPAPRAGKEAFTKLRYANLSSSAEGFIIRNSSFTHIRGRGALIETGFGLMAENYFNSITGFAVTFQSDAAKRTDAGFSEGPYPRNVVTRFNYFDTDAGYLSGGGKIFFTAEALDSLFSTTATTPVFQNILDQVRNNKGLSPSNVAVHPKIPGYVTGNPALNQP